MELYNRKIIGYVYGKHMTASLAMDAVKNVCLNKYTTGIILHSDLGSQYTSDLFENYMQANGFIHSLLELEQGFALLPYRASVLCGYRIKGM